MTRLDKRKILVVDDEPLIREILVEAFVAEGAEVEEAGNGREALALVEKKIFDVVVSDVRMPGGDGWELLQKIRAANRETPVVVFISGFSDVQADEAYARGLNAFFAKPFDSDVIVNSVARLVAPPQERWIRKHERLMADSQLEIRLPPYIEAKNANLVNIGQGGMFIRVDANLPLVGTLIEFTIHFNEGHAPSVINGIAQVRWQRKPDTSKDPPGVGVEFLKLSEEANHILLKIIAELKPVAFIPKT